MDTLTSLSGCPPLVVGIVHIYNTEKVKKGKSMFLYSAVSSLLDNSKRFTLFALPGRPVHSDTNSASPGSILAMSNYVQRLLTHISTTVYSQVLIYTDESREYQSSKR